jgi:hypothetical protein
VNRARPCESAIDILASDRRFAASIAPALTSGARGAGGPSPVRIVACST